MRPVWEQIFLEVDKRHNKKVVSYVLPLERQFLKQPDLLSALGKHQGQIQYHAGIFCVVFLKVFKR